MNLSELFKVLAQARIGLALDNGALRVDAPKGAVTPDILQHLKALKPEIIEYLGASSRPTEVIRPAQRQERMPLSFAQQRLWLIDSIDGGSAHYNMPGALKLTGDLDQDAVQRALSAVVERHESLRTVFAASEDGQPFQTVRPAAPLAVEVLDLSGLSGAEQRLRVEQEAGDEASLPFDLGRDTMLRARLLRLAEREHVLLVTMHHIASDGWSMAVLINEFSQLYAAFQQGQSSPLPPLAIQYADYAYWQRQWLQGEVLDKQLDYWQRQLAGIPAVHSMPLDFPRPPVQGFAGRQMTSRIGRPVADALQALCQAHGATLFMGLHAAFSVLLARYSNESDIVVGSPIANREQAEVAGLIGFFVNTLVLRSDVSGDPSFEQLIGQSRAMLLDAYAHQQVPFEQVVERLQPQRSLAHSPLFQVMLTLQNNEEGTLELPGLTLEPVAQEATIAKYDLSVDASATDDGLLLAWEYNTGLYQASTIERMARHFAQLLAAMVRQPDQCVHAIDMLDDGEKATLLRGFNATQAAYPTDRCLHEQFEEQVRRRPDSVALVHESSHLTYRELDARANRLAHWLRRERGVGPDRLVGLCIERSLDMVVGILAILKAGGAYVPLDPAYPEHRLAYMLGDAAPEAVLTHSGLCKLLPLREGQAVCLDDALLQEELRSMPEETVPAAASGVTPQHLAYVIYTSGSTGNPKGVMIRHSGVVNMVEDIGRRYGLTVEDRFLQFAPISFDMSVEDVFCALGKGCTLVLRADDWIASPAFFWERCAAQGVTVLNLPTAFWHELARARGCQPAASVRHITIGGEKVSETAIQDWFAMPGPLPRLINSYGPTECTVNASFASLSPVSTNTIGNALSNFSLVVLNSHQQLAPIGVAGELLIGGAGLSRGYLNRPELTAEKFIANPFHDPADAASSERLYRTGDLVRWLEDGNLEFLGRIDHQVKIRGFRIELGEIETALTSHPAVHDAVVLARQGANGDMRLVAYVVGAAGADALRSHLALGLPEYMVPSVFMQLDAMPLTPNGKVDRKALPEPDMSSAQAEYVAPRTATEEALCAIWQEVLGLERVGVTDNFFQLGGHSILATRLLAQINQRFAVSMPVKALFQSQTVATLAGELAHLSGTAAPSIAAVQRTARMPLSYAQHRLWLIDRIEGGSAHYNMPGALKLTGELDHDALQRALSAVVERHESLRTVFEAGDDGQPFQAIRPAAPLAVQVLDLSGLSGAEQRLRVEQEAGDEASLPFDLGRDTMLRARLLRLAEREHVLLVTMHHIASDGWSMAVLINEFSRLYAAFQQGHANPLPPLAIQYADYAHWQRQWLQGEVLEKQLDYWQKQLAGIPAVHSLPLDFPRPAVQGFAGRHVTSRIARPVADALQALCQAHGATLFMGLHAAFSVLLARYSNESDIVVGSPIANREQAEVAGLIGFFVNTLVLRSDLGGHPSFEQLIGQSRAMLLDAYAHQQVPFEQVVERLQPQRSLAHSPLFQVMLILQNNEEGRLELPGLSLEAVEQDVLIAKYDLTVDVSETEDGLLLAWECNTALYRPETIERMGRHFAALLEALVREPQRDVHAASMLDEQEQRLVLEGFNATGAEFRRGLCVHHLFEEQASRTPQAVALVHEGRELTYRALNERANRLAHWLLAQGVRADDRVAVCLERGFDMVAAVLAVLKASAAYVPLDPSYPAERLAYMLDDCAPAAVLSETALAAVLPAPSAPLLLLDGADSAAIDGQPGADPQSGTTGAQPSNLAYVIYTSGSTGNPKGVAMPHSAVVNLLQWQASRAPYLDTPEKTLQFAALGFDVAFQEIFTTLCAGASLVLIDESLRRDPVRLVGVLQREGVQRVYLPFVALQSLAEAVADSGAALPALRNIITAGEQLRVSPAIRQLARSAPGCRLHNHYGPTESHVVTALTLEGDADAWPALPSIGYPISNARIHILDSLLRPVPVGVGGELYIGGEVLARGYLGRGDLTAQRFVQSADGAVMYRTGDRARWLADGQIEYLGRNDFQVKIRGFRVELGEIESAIGADPRVHEVAVAALDAPGGGKRLVAYVAGAVDAGQLRGQLAQSLPEYMVPSAFVMLEALPVTPNGKVDRKALPVPDLASAQSDYVAPRTATEEALCVIWQEVLGLERVGVTDNFFQLGGHSILATRLLAQINQRCGVAMPVKTLFQAQTVASLAVELAQLAGTAVPPVVAVARRETMPVSFAQQRLWLIDRIEGGSAHYNMPAALKLSGELDRNALQRALSAVVERHESLRTVFAVGEDGQPLQVIRAAAPLAVQVLDLRGLASAEQRLRVEDEAADEAATPFELARDLMLRARLLRLAEREHVLLVTMHHIASDGWSMAVLINEFSRLYAAFQQGQANPLPPLAIQYADYAHWQRQWLQGEVLEKQLDYWQKQLAGIPVAHSLPLDFPRPAVQGFAGRHVASRIARPVADALQALCQAHGATLFMGLHAAFSVLLARYSNESDIVIGSPIANREQAEVAGLIGFFVNTLVLRSDVGGNPTFAGLLGRSRAMLLDAYAHQQVPFEQVVERLQPQRSLAHSPLFQVMLILQNNEEGRLELPGLSLEPAGQGASIAKYDLTLDISDTGDGLALAWEYNIDLFQDSTIARMAQHFGVLLANLVATPDVGVHQLELMDAPERQRLLEAFNDTAAPYPADASMASLFAAQARRTPDALALAFRDSRLSYRELDEQANRLAHWLRRERGVGPERRVGICIGRSLDMVVGMLAVLKAGGAYVPLDPAYPEQRIAYMLDDASLDTVITHSTLLERTPLTAKQAVCLDDPALRQALAAMPPQAPSLAELRPEHLAYVIYTSGSTGNPKGVMIEHRNAVAFLTWAQAVFDREQFACVLAATSICFDLSVFELFATLCAGGTALVVENVLELQSGRLALAPTLLNTVPSAAEALLAGGHLPASVRTVNLAGEPLKQRIVDELYGRGVARVYDLYGPSEDTTYSTFVLRTRHGAASIGKPVDNTRAYVLNGQMALVPPGIAGELYLGGACLSRGYLNRPELTAEKFIANPWHDAADPHSPARLYRTGDLVRWNAKGHLEYIGRIDHQVKIRGFRVELGEIEAALAAHPAVQDALVLARDADGDKRLVAYVVGAAQPEALQAHLAQSLPAYMLPAAYVVLDAFPQTPNGKVDRKALPAPGPAGTQAERVAPRTALEATLCAVWAEALGLPQVGATDNLFELGVHSLMALKAVARIRQETGIELALRTLFVHPTVAELAQAMQRPGQGGEQANLVQIRPGNRAQRLPLFLVHPMEGEVGYARNLAARLDADLPLYALAAVGLLEGETPIQGLEAMATAYLHSVRRVQPNGPYRLAGWSAGGMIAYEMGRQLVEAGEKVSFLGLIDTPSDYADEMSAIPAPSGDQDADDAAMLLLDLAQRQPAAARSAELAQWAREGDLAAMMDYCRGQGIFPHGVEDAVLRRHVAVRAAMARSMAAYRRPAAALTVSLFLAMEGREQLALGWDSVNDVQCEMLAIGGTHYSIVEEPYVGRLALAISLALAAPTPSGRRAPETEAQ